MPVKSGGGIGLARVDGQQIAARFVGREFGDVAARRVLAELHIDVAHFRPGPARRSC